MSYRLRDALALNIPHAVLEIISRKRTALIRRHAIIRETVDMYPKAVPEAALGGVDELVNGSLAKLDP
jgi:hypothetical protein